MCQPTPPPQSYRTTGPHTTEVPDLLTRAANSCLKSENFTYSTRQALEAAQGGCGRSRRNRAQCLLQGERRLKRGGGHVRSRLGLSLAWPSRVDIGSYNTQLPSTATTQRRHRPRLPRVNHRSDSTNRQDKRFCRTISTKNPMATPTKHTNDQLAMEPPRKVQSILVQSPLPLKIMGMARCRGKFSTMP